VATIAPQVPVLARDEAFEKLYRRYVKDVYHYALALLHNPADAEDVTQTTFLNAYRAYQRGEVIQKPQNWLIKIAHNVARSRYARISRRVKEVPLEEHVEQLALPEDEKPNVEGVLRALGGLPFNQRAALVMRELEGRSYTEIGDTLGVSIAAVETLIFRARRSLRVRTAALRSILTVPVPSSLGQFFGGSGAGAVGGIGSGLLIKAAVVLVVGGLAAGVGVERSTRAVAARHHAAAPSSLPADAVPVHIAGAVRAHAHRRPRSDHRARGTGFSPHSSVLPAIATTPRPAAAGTAATPAAVPTSGPASSTSALTTVVPDTVQTVVGTVDQVTASLPVSVPQVPPLPIQAPLPVPKLP
jgi:RNA polymerase sigma factor (sigma-70 family)